MIKLVYVLIFLVISLFGIGNTAVAYVPSPHGNYITNQTDKCANCHVTHNGAQQNMAIKTSEYNLCMVCHDGVSGPIATNFPNTSQHLWDAKNSYCSGCHDPHKSQTDPIPHLLRDKYSPQTKTGVPGDYQLCFDCHQNTAKTGTGFVQSSYDIFQFYNKSSNLGAGTYGTDKGHFIKSPTGTYTFADGTAVNQDYELSCTDCHDKHGSKNKKMLKEKLGDNPNVITLTDASTSDLTVAEERSFCQGCHNGTTHLYNSTNINTILWNPQANSGHTDTTKKCTLCHGGSGTSAQQAMHGAHAPTNALSTGGQDCANCHSNITSSSTATNNGSFHHVSDQYTFDITKYTKNKSCFQCHVDHDKFNPGPVGNLRGANIRSIFDSITGSAVPVDTDFLNSAYDPGYTKKGGLCLSCHLSQQTKNYDSTKQVHVLPQPAVYESSAHNYTASSTFKDNSTFKANCAKCHNDNLVKENWQSSNQFGTHSSTYSSILTPFADQNAVNPMNEKFCYKCHSNLTSTTADMYGTAMSAKSKGIYDIFNSTTGSKHNITGSTGLTCVSCHGSHTVAKTRDANISDITDPSNTLTPFTTASGNISNFCIKCHGATPPTGVNNGNAFVPNSIVFSSIVFTSNFTGWNKEVYLNSGHYAKLINCDTCHDKHGSNYARLLLNDEDTATSDGVCLKCHNGTVIGAANVKGDLTAGSDFTYRHPTLDRKGLHSDNETYPQTTANRHAACSDCHDPHAANAAMASGGNVTGKIANTMGVSPIYSVLNSTYATPTSYVSGNVNKEYQLCFKCHTGYNGNYPTPPVGAMAETDLAREFNPKNPAFHDVGLYTGLARSLGISYQTGTNLNDNTVLYCSSCHGADVGTATLTAGSGAVHGSSNQYILKGAWNSTLNLTNSTSANNLCLKCHNLSTTSNFTNGTANLHANYHGNISCQACHSEVPHGGKRPGMIVVTVGSPSANNPSYAYDASYDGIYGKNSTIYLRNWKSGGTYWNASDCGNCH